MKEDAILRVTIALRDRLQTALDAANIPGDVFVGPLDDKDVQGAPLILFLYRLVPNPSLRNRERRVPAASANGVDVFRNSLPLDLHFLITVGAAEGSEESMLRPLGLALQSLQLQSELNGAAVNHETVRVTLDPLTVEESSRIWALFPAANYRTSVAYIASPVWIDPPSPEPTAAPVIDDRLRAGTRPTEVSA